jgi:hypothetical protein
LNSEHILIPGGSGLIGTRLTELLRQKGHVVAHLSRSGKNGPVTTYPWNPDDFWIDPAAIRGRTVIINLAGANVGEKRWTKKRKKEILESRIKSAAILCNELKRGDHQVHTYISASGTSYYGTNNDVKFFTEGDPPGHDFLAEVTQAWENEADTISTTGVRVVKLRTAPVLSADNGLLSRFITPIRWFVGAPLGTGKQFMSWIHINDICRIYEFAMENRALEGVFNAVAPQPVTNREFVKCMAHVLKRPILLPPVPHFVLQLMFGEMAVVAVGGSKVSAEKIMKAGFTFRFDTLSKAMNDIF